MQNGIVISNISDLYKVESNNLIYNCNARGKFKAGEISPVAGDKVEIDVTDEEKKAGVIEKILGRKNYLKRPKMANLTQIILVVSMKLPKPDLLLLDKQLAYSEYMNIKPIICLNKIDVETHNIVLARVLDAKKENENIPMTYSYYHQVIKGNAPKTAPTYIETEETAKTGGKKYKCKICGYIYDEEKEKIKFEDLSNTWKCPLCKVEKDMFEEIKE